MHPASSAKRPGIALSRFDAGHVLEQLADVVCVLDAGGRIVYVNGGSAALWGIAADDLTGKSLELVLADGAVELVRMLQPGAVQYEGWCLHAAGHRTYCAWTLRWQPGEDYWYGVVRSVRPPSFNPEQIVRAQELAGIVHFEYDVVNRRFPALSSNFYNICGVSHDQYPELTADLFWQLVHPDDRDRLRYEFFEAPNQPPRQQHHYRMVRPDGKLIYLNHNRELYLDNEGRHVRTLGAFQDVTPLREYEQALRLSEKKFRALAIGGSDMMAMLSAEGIITYVSSSVEHLLGYTVADVEGQSVFNFVHPDDLAYAMQQLMAITTQPQLRMPPIRICNHAGEWRWLEAWMTNMIGDPDLAGIVLNGRDVTEQKLWRDRIQDLSLIAEESMHAILITDTHHRITWANKAMTRISGYTLEELQGRSPDQLFSISLQSVAQHHELWSRLESGLTVQQELLCYSKDGAPMWMHLHVQPMYDAHGQVRQYLAMGKDITERKKAAAELELSEQRFKALVQEGSDLTVVVDEQGHFTYSSHSLHRVLGYDPAEILHKHLLSFIHPDDIAETIAGIERVRTFTVRGGVRHRFRRKDGEYIWLESRGTNHYHNPVIRGMIVNARDITDQVLLQERLEEERRSKQQAITSAVIKAQESERSALGLELHDNVNQVLTTVKLYVEMYMGGYKQDPTLLERGTRYLQDCINEIRSISKRLSAPTLGRISLHDSIGDLVAGINCSSRVPVAFTSEGLEQLFIPEDLHLSIYRIIQEGLTNSIKYADASKASVHIACQEGSLLLTVADNGKGFDMNARRGGIGITNMKTRAEHMNGIFHLYTGKGKGCRIDVRFQL